MYGVSPLTDSLNLRNVRHRLFGLPQLHLASADDSVVPLCLLQDFLRAYPFGAPVRLIVLPEIDYRLRTRLDLTRLVKAVGGLPASADPAIIENVSRLGNDLADFTK